MLDDCRVANPRDITEQSVGSRSLRIGTRNPTAAAQAGRCKPRSPQRPAIRGVRRFIRSRPTAITLRLRTWPLIGFATMPTQSPATGLRTWRSGSTKTSPASSNRFKERKRFCASWAEQSAALEAHGDDLIGEADALQQGCDAAQANPLRGGTFLADLPQKLAALAETICRPECRAGETARPTRNRTTCHRGSPPSR